MTTYYVDPADGGTNSGTLANPWTSFQSALDTAAVGDIVLCQGTQTLAAILDYDSGNSGEEKTGFIKFIGTNSSWVNDGTRFVIDGNDAVANCIALNATQSYTWFENIEIKNATSTGLSRTSGAVNYGTFINVSVHDHGGSGVDGFFWFYLANLIRCTFYNNSGRGVINSRINFVAFSSFHDNSSLGLQSLNGKASFGNLFYDNGAEGGDDFGDGNVSLFNVFNNNSLGGAATGGRGNPAPVFIGNRFTNNTDSINDFGLNAQGVTTISGWNYFEDNDANIDDATYAQEILLDGVGTNDEDNADTTEGYTDLTDGSEDFSLRSDASLRRTAITIPLV